MAALRSSRRSPWVWPLAALAGAVGATLAARAVVQRSNREKARLPDGLDEQAWVDLGGLEQWVTIRGRDLANPVVLVLHGGPGSSMSLVDYKAFPGWEADFTVVNWDQRGSGRTFLRHGERCGRLTIARMTDDAIELAESLRRRFPGRPLIVLGVSWGSVLGIELVRRRPDLVDAYVGAGQAVDMPEGEVLSYFGALERLEARGRLRDAAVLRAIPPPPYDGMKAVGLQRRLLVSTMPPAEQQAFRQFILEMLVAPQASLLDLIAVTRGGTYSLQQLWDELIEWRMADGGLSFEPPMLFIQGGADLQTPTALVSRIAPQIRAPKAEVIVFPGAGHVALLTHASDVLRIMTETVRPMAQARASAGATARRA